jgi:hypothetical protein
MPVSRMALLLLIYPRPVTQGSDFAGKMGTFLIILPESLRCVMDSVGPVGRSMDIWSLTCDVLRILGENTVKYVIMEVEGRNVKEKDKSVNLGCEARKERKRRTGCDRLLVR